MSKLKKSQVLLNKEQISNVWIRRYPTLDRDYKRKGNKIVWTHSLFWDSNPDTIDYFRTLEEYRVINNAIVLCPNISITMSSGINHKIYFKTIRELEQWYENNLSDVNFIEVT